jgi:hypothetical protein
VYCSLDKIDLAATVDGKHVAIQTDHRSGAEIASEPELSTLYAMARVLNARSHIAEHPSTQVNYVVVGEPPDVLRAALRAAGAAVFTTPRLGCMTPPIAIEIESSEGGEAAVGELADRAFRQLARRAAAQVGTRDIAIALRMLEDQTIADPPSPSDEPAYWRRVLELAALTGELLRAKCLSHGQWVQTDRALVPFGFQLASCDRSTAVMFPTNRAQRLIEDGRDQSLFKLLVAADEAMQRPDASSGRLMPSLRDRKNVELDEIVWRALVDHGAAELPVVVCGIDGESTFGMIRREALDRPADEAIAEALANLAEEPVQIHRTSVGVAPLLVVSGSFYAAEKLLEHAFMLGLHAQLGPELVAAVPSRGLLLVTSARAGARGQGPRDAAHVARFATLARSRHDDANSRAISPHVMLVSGGRVEGYVRE